MIGCVAPTPGTAHSQASEYQNYPWSAEDMGRFVTERTQLKPGAIERPSFLKSPLFPVLLLALLSLGAWLAFKLYSAEFMKNPLIWMVAVIAVYWFSVSGGMFNIIRGVPMQHWDKRTGNVRPRPSPVFLRCLAPARLQPGAASSVLCLS